MRSSRRTTKQKTKRVSRRGTRRGTRRVVRKRSRQVTRHGKRKKSRKTKQKGGSNRIIKLNGIDMDNNEYIIEISYSEEKITLVKIIKKSNNKIVKFNEITQYLPGYLKLKLNYNNDNDIRIDIILDSIPPDIYPKIIKNEDKKKKLLNDIVAYFLI
jgi:hypothetical protein